MPDAKHFDDVALRHGDPLTSYLDGAVDEADAGGTPTMPVPIHRVATEPVKLDKDCRFDVRFSESDYARVVAAAGVDGVRPATWIRDQVLGMLDRR